jgi:hypothetical protein
MFKQQLRALVRAGMQHPITVLFPMVTTIDELRAARALLAEAATRSGRLREICRPGSRSGPWLRCRGSRSMPEPPPRSSTCSASEPTT